MTAITYFLIWFPALISVAIFAATAVRYADIPRFRGAEFLRYRTLIPIVIGTRFFYALLATGAQYYIWQREAFSRLLLPPYRSWGYFAYYMFSRFWLEIVIALLVAYCFWLFLTSLGKFRERFFEEGEKEIGFLMAFTVGWPHLIIFIALTCALVILFSLARMLLFKETYTTFGLPFLWAGIFTFLYGGVLVEALGLGVLSI